MPSKGAKGNEPDEEKITSASTAALNDEEADSESDEYEAGAHSDEYEAEQWDAGNIKLADEHILYSTPEMIDSAPDTVETETRKRRSRFDFDGTENEQEPTGRSDSDEDDSEDAPSLVDELGVEDLIDILFVERGRILSAAGRDAPIAELGQDGMLLRPAQLPWLDEPPQEEIVYRYDEHGILLNELGEQRKIIGARYQGKPLFVIAEQKPETVKHYVAWFDDQMNPHKLYVKGSALTADMVFRLRNRTHDGEVSIFPEVKTD